MTNRALFTIEPAHATGPGGRPPSGRADTAAPRSTTRSSISACHRFAKPA